MSAIRIAIARTMIQVSQLLQSFAMLVMRPDDLVEFSRRTYARPRDVAGWGQPDLLAEGLYENEVALLQQSPVQAGKLLLLGLGGGRDAIPLAQRGFQVTGVDFVPAMVDLAVANAAKQGLHIEGVVQEISRLDVPTGAFDLVWLSARMYSSIPTRRRRMAMLARIAKALQPGGCFICMFDWSPGRALSSRDLLARRLFARITFGHVGYEPGDRLLHNMEFLHSFDDEQSVRSEFAEGGFEVLHLELPAAGYGGAVLRKASPGPRPSV